LTLSPAILRYLEDIDITPSVTRRIEFIADQVALLLPSETEFDSVVVSEYVGEDGIRTYESLWLTAGGVLSEARNFMAEEQVDFIVITNAIDRVELTKTNYQPGKATPESRLSVQFSTKTRVVGHLRASGQNCEPLYSWAREVLIANLT
jgi:hypothetical protein